MKLKLVAILCAIASSAFAQSGIRQFQIVSDNLQFPAPVNVEWMQGESPQFVITAKQGNFYVGFSNGASVVLKAWAGNITTQLYANKTGTVDTAKQGKATVELLASEANFAPTGRYNYAVGVYDGTNYMGIIAQGVATVRGHPFGNNIGYVGTTSPFPYVPTNDAAFLNAITNIIAGTNVTVSRSGRQVTVNASASGGGGAGTFTNVTIGTNVMTAQAIIQPESNIVTRAAGGTNYIGLAGTIANAITFSGAINANDHIEIANTKHLRFQDGGGTNTVHLAGSGGRLVITGALDVVTGQATPFTVNGIPPLYVQSETNASARLASNVWASSDSTTNYMPRWNGGIVPVSGWQTAGGYDGGSYVNNFGQRIDFRTTNSARDVFDIYATSTGAVPSGRGGMTIWAYGIADTNPFTAGTRSPYLAIGLHSMTSANQGVLMFTRARGTNDTQQDFEIWNGSASGGSKQVLTITAEGHLVSSNDVSGARFIGDGSLLTNLPIASVINASTNVGARLSSNIWAVADSTTNYVLRTGGTYYGSFTLGSPDAFNYIQLINDGITLIASADTTQTALTINEGLISAAVGYFSGPANGLTDIPIATGIANGSGILTNGGTVATNYLPRTGGTMTGGITNNVGFFGNGAGLTNLPVSPFSIATNYVLRASDRWNPHPIPTNPLALATAFYSATNTVAHQVFRTLQTQQMTRTASLTFSRTSAETNGWIGFALPYVAQTNIVTNTVQFMISGATQVVSTVNLTTSGFYTVSSGSLSNQVFVDALFTGFAASPGSTNYGLAFPPDIWGAAQ